MILGTPNLYATHVSVTERKLPTGLGYSIGRQVVITSPQSVSSKYLVYQ